MGHIGHGATQRPGLSAQNRRGESGGSARGDQEQVRALLGIAEAAAYLGISPGTLRNWLSMKRIAYVKVGRLTKVSRETLDAYIAAHTVHAEPEHGGR